MGEWVLSKVSRIHNLWSGKQKTSGKRNSHNNKSTIQTEGDKKHNAKPLVELLNSSSATKLGRETELIHSIYLLPI